MLQADLHSLVALAAHIALSVTFVSAMGVFALKVFQHTNAPVRHTIALSFLAGVILVPPLVAMYPSSVVESSSIVSARRVIEVPVATGPSQAKPVEASPAGRFQESPTSSLFYGMLATLAAVWLAGAVVLTVARVIKTYRQRQYLIRLPGVTNASVLEMVDRLGREMGIGRNVRVLQSRHTPWPFTVGIVRPQIILPTDLVHDPESRQLYATVVHELAHVSRYDYAVVMFEGFLRTLFWWNPFVYSLVTQLDVAREEICDSFVFNHDGDGQSLAEYLVLSMEHVANAKLSAWGVGMSANEPHNVEFRINRLIHGDKLKMKHLSKIANVLICFCPMIACLASVHTNYAHAQFVIGTPVNFGPVINSTSTENDPFLSHDGLTLYFNSGRQGGEYPDDIWISTRDSIESEWNQPESFTEINTDWAERRPTISSDGLTFLYTRSQPAGHGKIYQLKRDLPVSPWGPPTLLPAPINDGVTSVGTPFMSSNSLTLHFSRPDGNNRGDIWEAVRTSLDDPWTMRELGPNVNTSVKENSPVMAADGLTLLFASNRPGGEGELDIWMSTRDTIGEEWGQASNLGPTINTPGQERPSQLWEPGNLLLFKSGSLNGPSGLLGEGASDLFYVSVIPEPSTVAMSFSGALLLMGFARRRRKRA